MLRLAGIRQQLSAPGCPWQNGRIEQLFGTLKSKLDRWRLRDRKRTPLEAWQSIDPYRRAPKWEEWFEAWDGLLQGYHLRY